MNSILTLGIALLVVVFHAWASRRSPRYWFLGGIVPLVWAGLLLFLWFQGQVHLPSDWRMVLFPSILLLLIWLQGNQAAKKREMDRMKAKDL